MGNICGKDDQSKFSGRPINSEIEQDDHIKKVKFWKEYLPG